MLTVHQATDLKEKGVRVISMNPGWVKTRMGGEGAVLEPEDSISGMLKVMQGLKDDETAKFYSYDGKQLPW
jgi:NAD(P)-dependent dehydrogenase (short-subunit alcohol dehydrogenase family)